MPSPKRESEAPSLADSLLGFEVEANTLLVGPTSSGKTTLLKRILGKGIFTHATPQRVFVLVPDDTSTDWNDVEFDAGRKLEIKVLQGVKALDSFLANSHNTPPHSVVIFDDYMLALSRAERREALEKWFSVTTHHRHLWTFFVTHDMFHKNLTTIRRNTQNFLMFNVLQADYRAAKDFIDRLVGQASSSVFMLLWQAAVESHGGWIRLDQKIHASRNPHSMAVKMVVSMAGVSSADGALVACRSDGEQTPLKLDVLTNPDLADTDRFVLADSDIVARIIDSHGNRIEREEPTGGVPADGPHNLQQSDGH